MFRNLLTIICFSLFSQIIISQIIWTEPAFPKAGDEMTIYFDATEGTAGLAGCNCNVYLHTGVITSLSTGPSDWKHVQTTWGVANPDWQLSPVSGQPDVYSYVISPSIMDYYQVGGGETIEKMAFVFRSADGSLEGKDDGGADIFYEVYPDDLEFTSILLAPSSSGFFAEIGEFVDINVSANDDAAFSLYDNGSLVTETMGTAFSYSLEVTEMGNHEIEIIADNGTEQITNAFNFLVISDSEIAALPVGMKLGINYIDESTVLFALEAPNKNNVFLIGDFNNWSPFSSFQLKNTPDGQIWWIQIDGLTPGEEVRFQYLVDGEIRIADPYSELVLDPWNDPWIPEVTYPNLLDYPTDMTNGIVGVIQPDAPEFDWQVTSFEKPAKEKLVIYELLMRDFLDRHDYQTLLDTLDYLDRLGINAIEFMPVNEFSGNISWGYNPTFHGALDKYYGTKNDFKTIIDACHEKGIAVILDVVFNHAHEHNPLAALYWDSVNFRPAADNPWMNQQAPHDFSVFFDYNHDSPSTKAYVEKILKYWLEEYQVDGFRFDLSKGLTQNVNGPFDAGAYDPVRITLLKQYADAIWETTDDAYVILEHFAANNEESELVNYGCMMWGGFTPHHQYLEAAMGWNSNLTSASYKSRGWATPALIAYMESHDEERMQYKNSQWGNGNGAYQVKELETGLERDALASAFYYMIPGPKMIWQFGELGYDFSINYCQNGTINESCRVDPKPIRWDYRDDEKRYELFTKIRALIHLREHYDLFHTDDFTLNVSNQTWKRIHLNGQTMNATIIGNFGMVTQNNVSNFQHTGTWYDYMSGNQLEVTQTNQIVSLEPGEFVIYVDEEITRPGFLMTGSSNLFTAQFDFNIAPNPTNTDFNIGFSLEKSELVKVDIFDVSGKLVKEVLNNTQLEGEQNLTIKNEFSAGIYFVKLQIGNASETRKLVISK